jgi:hypothetical protein
MGRERASKAVEGRNAFKEALLTGQRSGRFPRVQPNKPMLINEGDLDPALYRAYDRMAGQPPRPP